MTDEPPGLLIDQIDLVDTGALELHPSNPRQGDVGAIIESIQANGFFDPLVAQLSTRRVLSGNHRLIAARQLGMAQVPVVWVDVDDDRALRILLVANRANDLATYNDSALAALLTDMAQQTPLGLTGTGFSGDALDQLLADLAAPAPLAYQRAEDESARLLPQWAIIVNCRDEAQQLELLGRLSDDGLDCKALTG